MKRFVVVLALALAACASPQVDMADAKSVRCDAEATEFAEANVNTPTLPNWHPDPAAPFWVYAYERCMKRNG